MRNHVSAFVFALAVLLGSAVALANPSGGNGALTPSQVVPQTVVQGISMGDLIAVLCVFGGVMLLAIWGLISFLNRKK